LKAKRRNAYGSAKLTRNDFSSIAVTAFIPSKLPEKRTAGTFGSTTRSRVNTASRAVTGEPSSQ